MKSSLGIDRFPALLAVVALGLCAAQAGAQQTPAATTPAPATTAPGVPQENADPVLQQSATMQMKSLEPAPDEEYTLGGGDEISVQVPGHPELSVKQTIGPDGRITLPTAGTVNVYGMSRDQASAAVQKAYGQYYRDPSASISIDKYGSNRVMVTGAVQKQGYVYFQQTPSLLEAITEAGLVQPTGSSSYQGQGRNGGRGQQGQGSNGGSSNKSALMPQECKIFEGSGENQKVVTVNLRQLLTSSNGITDIRLRRDAVIYVQNPQDRFVSVLGEVTRPGPVQLDSNYNLAEIISSSGGLTDHAGNNPNIAIVDPATKKIRYIRFKDAISPGGMNEISLQPGDLIVVPKANLAKVGYFFQQIGPITGLASVFALTSF